MRPAEQQASAAAPSVDCTLVDGSRLTIRPACREDAQRMVSFVRNLSFGTRYFRFGRWDFEFDEQEALQLCTPDPRDTVQLIALNDARSGEEMVGAARLVLSTDRESCELSITVRDDWQARGIGGRLVGMLLTHARRWGCKSMQARILATNQRMMNFMRRHGFAIDDSQEGTWLKVATIGLQQHSRSVD